MAGIKNKDEEFWSFVKEYDFIGMVETWIEEKEWNTWKKKLPVEWTWLCQGATRTSKKGRAKGGIITGIKKEMDIQKREMGEKEGIQRRWLKIKEEEWEILTIYNREGKIEKLREIGEYVEEGKENMIIMGDFNARIGEEGDLGWGQDQERKEETRSAKDKVKNKEGEKLLELVEERGWIIMNGNKEGDEEGEWTYNKGEGKSTIDYGITSMKAWEKIKEFRIEARVESDHEPLVVKIEGRREERRESEKKETKVQNWGKEEKDAYRKTTEKIEWQEEQEVEVEWERIKKVVEENVSWKKRGKGRKLGWQPWWDGGCRQEKKELQKKWKEVNKGERTRVEYRRCEREYKKKCEEKKELWKKKEEDKIAKIKTEKEAWEFINRERKRKEGICKNIEEEEWRKHFMESLDGRERPEAGRRGKKGKTKRKKKKKMTD